MNIDGLQEVDADRSAVLIDGVQPDTANPLSDIDGPCRKSAEVAGQRSRYMGGRRRRAVALAACLVAAS